MENVKGKMEAFIMYKILVDGSSSIVKLPQADNALAYQPFTKSNQLQTSSQLPSYIFLLTSSILHLPSHIFHPISSLSHRPSYIFPLTSSILHLPSHIFHPTSLICCRKLLLVVCIIFQLIGNNDR